MEEKLTLKGKVTINGKIKLESGIHIGGTKETLKIGGMDNPVIKDKNDNIFIPGSSLKGKIRSLLEKKDGKIKFDGRGNALPCDCGGCEICKIFGPHDSKNIKEPVRIIVRDAYLELNGKKPYEYLEVKPENTIDRVKGTTIKGGIRNIERVVAGSEFNFEIVFNIYKNEDKNLIKKFIEGMKLLEDDYLGGCGSRGYGKIKFKDIMLIHKPKAYYEGDKNAITVEKNIHDVEELYSKVEKLTL
ncbi:type III-A CRISPR-associated RAMP protein Csm3 [Methanotorris formicicus]|uniref:CRISPR system Cms endoribonuclease Csm3 n=1 Tax=Methanotorris formicicus Mc-S-70 TaxID=647171 RepID=H1KYT0_9EURY|nr:type III-A CRISPR-associated RAMP protein Csm3 [Methanotorris formicicus]EHP86827.1 CRISPR-associated RAMP protein, Csm3 family [Methanotorris formicicus Mc-S-70]